MNENRLNRTIVLSGANQGYTYYAMTQQHQTYCCHCGKLIDAATCSHVYSVLIDQDTERITIAHELLAGALNYCSDNCMFKRRDGHPPLKEIKAFLDSS